VLVAQSNGNAVHEKIGPFNGFNKWRGVFDVQKVSITQIYYSIIIQNVNFCVLHFLINVVTRSDFSLNFSVVLRDFRLPPRSSLEL